MSRSGPQATIIGMLEPSTMPAATLSALGQDSGGPSGVEAQSCEKAAVAVPPGGTCGLAGGVMADAGDPGFTDAKLHSRPAPPRTLAAAIRRRKPPGGWANQCRAAAASTWRSTR